MDVGVIVGILGTALANLAEPVVKKAYEDLKGLIKGKFGEGSRIQATLEDFEEDQETWAKGLQKRLAEANAAEDPDIRAAVEALQAKLNALEELGKLQPGGVNIVGSTVTKSVVGSPVGGDAVMGDILKDQARKIDTGGGDYVEGTQTKYTPGSTHIEQTISGASGSTIIGQQNRYGPEDEDE